MPEPNHLRRNLGNRPIEPVRKIPAKVTAVFHRRRVFDPLGKDVLFKHGAERRGSLALGPPANLRVFATCHFSEACSRFDPRFSDGQTALLQEDWQHLGNGVRLTVLPGDCPGIAVDGLPDFDSATSGDQDTALIAGGRSKKAKVRLRLRASDFPNHNPVAPRRCTLQLSAISGSASEQFSTRCVISNSLGTIDSRPLIARITV